MIRKRIGLILTAVGLAAVTACGGNSGQSPAPTAPANSNEIVIGAAVAKTGGQTFYGGPAMVAAQAAIDDINKVGGVNGKKIRLVWEDSQTDFAKSAAAAQSVISQGAQVLLVDCDFDYGLPAAQVAQKAGLVAMNLCAGSPRAGDPKLLSNAFSMGLATNVEAAAIAGYAYNVLGHRKVYLLRDNSIEYSKSVCDYFKAAWTQLGGQIAGEDGFNNADTSVQAQVSKLRGAAGSYDAINVCSYPPGLTTAVRQIRSAGIDAPLLGSVTWDGDFWLGPQGAGDLSNVYFPAYGSIWGDDPRPKVNELVTLVRSKMGGVPLTSFTLPGYSAIEGLARGIEKAGTTEGAALRTAMESFTNENFLVGPVTYNDRVHTRMVGDNQVAIMKVDGGKPKFVQLYAPTAVAKP